MHDAGFRNQMLDAVRGFSASRQNGLFINSCFAHCQSERQDTWYANNSPRLGNKVRVLETKANNEISGLGYTKHFVGEVSRSVSDEHSSTSYGSQKIADAVGDWFFERGNAKYTDCPYPCDGTCHHLVFRGDH